MCGDTSLDKRAHSPYSWDLALVATATQQLCPSRLTAHPLKRRRALLSQAPWCDQPWCYVDPGNCDTDVGYSSVWPSNVSTRCELESEARCQLAFSYTTCGSSDAFTEKSYVTMSRNFMQLKLSQVLLQCGFAANRPTFRKLKIE